MGWEIFFHQQTCYDYNANTAVFDDIGDFNGKLLKLTYGNGDYEEYIYDNLDRLVSVKFNGTVEYTLIYDANGRLHSMTEGTTTHVYEYDSLDRLIRAYQKDANGIIVAVENTYDEFGRAKGSTYAIGDKTMEYSVTYKQNSNLVSSLRMPDASEDSQMSVIDYTYDNFDRLTEKVISMSSNADLSEEYLYYTYTDADGERHTTSLVSSITLRSSNASGYDVVYSYVYDNLGNITDVFIEGIPVESYEYDSLGQLIRENNVFEDYTKLYEYDKAGNIRYTSVMPYTSAPSANIAFAEGSILPYGYSTSAWGDMLTSYGATSISYDAIGNPTNWRNSSSMSWDARRLTNQRMNNSDWLTYTYNADGIRTQKYFFNDVEMYGTTHDYVLDGTNIIRETVTGDGNNYTLHYLYDETGEVQGFIYNNSYYYFQKNLQRDVVRIVNSSGTVVTEYTYDVWGKVLSVSGTMANTLGQYNPFRYRSYYYDVETGFYYLKSRYYDPVVGRFINADSATMIGANGKLASNNLFTYALNNPTMLTDPNGYDAIVLAKTAGIPPHMGALIQDEDGNWWHFYWGVSGFWYCIGTFFGAPVPVTTWCQPYEGELSLEAINDSKQYESYDSIEYLTGDFSESLQYAQAPGEYYHLYSDNCMHKTLKILAVSNNNHSKTLLDASERMTISGAFEHIEESLTGHNFANSIVNTAIESSNSNNRKTSSICKNNNNRLALIK